MQIEILDYVEKNGKRTKGFVKILLFGVIEMNFRLRFNKKLYVEMPIVHFSKKHSHHCIRLKDKKSSDAFQKAILDLIEVYKSEKKNIDVKDQAD